MSHVDETRCSEIPVSRVDLIAPRRCAMWFVLEVESEDVPFCSETTKQNAPAVENRRFGVLRVVVPGMALSTLMASYSRSI